MDIEKTTQYLLEQQARFDARQAEFEAYRAKFEKDVSTINDILLRVAAAQERTNEILVRAVEKHVELAEKHGELAEEHKKLSRLHESSETRLNALIAAVDRHIENHN